MSTIAWIGLGHMGLPMTKNLMRAGHTVRGFDLSEPAMNAAAEAGVASVVSAHDFTDTPPSKQLLRTLKAMADLGADVAKVAVMPHDRSDVLEALKAADRGRARLRIPIIVIAMGRRGKLTRLIGGEFGSAATFATVGEGSAPGQVSASEVLQTLQILAGED